MLKRYIDQYIDVPSSSIGQATHDYNNMIKIIGILRHFRKYQLYVIYFQILLPFSFGIGDLLRKICTDFLRFN